MDKKVMRELNRLMEEGRHVALVLISETGGSSPRREGSMMIVEDSGEILMGTIGGGAIEEAARKDAMECIRKNEDKSFHYELTMKESEHALGMACGGVVDVLVKVFRSMDELVLVGGGHIGLAVANMAKELPFDVIVIDNREEFANRERFPDAAQIYQGDIGEKLQALKLHKNASIVIITHGHLHDIEALEVALQKDVRYVGMIGSRNKIKFCLDTLRERGFEESKLESVFAPIGLNIGGDSPGEIALGILAEIQARKYEKILSPKDR